MIVITAAVIIMGLTLSSCKKGDTGPAGPVGSNGTNGVANIQTTTVTSNNNSWVFDSVGNSYDATITYTAITQAVVDRGTVQVFLGSGNGTEWLALPFSYGIAQYLFSYSLGKVDITATLSNNAIPNNPGGQQFKVVVIPPASKSSQQQPNETNERVEQIFKIN